MSEFEEPSFQETEALLESVLSNKKLTKIQTVSKIDFVVFYYPPASEVIHSRFIREKALLEAENEGLPSTEEVDEIIESRSLVSEEDKKELKELEDKLEGQKAILEKTNIPGRKAPLEEIIKGIESKISELKSKRESFFYLSKEKKADEESFLFLVWASTYNINGDKYWETFEDFEKETDLDFRTVILINFGNFNRGLDTHIIRFLARHSLWRIRYMAALKTGAGDSLFPRGLHDLTPDQLALLYWSNYYQSIYEMLPDEQPDDDTIKNDEALDAFMEAYFDKREREKQESKSASRTTDTTKGYKQKLNAWDKGQELIITPSHPDYMKLAYTEERKKSKDGAADIEEVSPQSRRARNRRKMSKRR